jgi:hypothetical protein
MKVYRVELPGKVVGPNDPDNVIEQVERELRDPKSQAGKEYRDAMARIAESETLDPRVVARINIR